MAFPDPFRSGRQPVTHLLNQWCYLCLEPAPVFDKDIENEAFTGSPTIVVTRVTEENDVVLAEGSVRAERKDDGTLHAVFCDTLKWKIASNSRFFFFFFFFFFFTVPLLVNYVYYCSSIKGFKRYCRQISGSAAIPFFFFFCVFHS